MPVSSSRRQFLGQSLAVLAAGLYGTRRAHAAEPMPDFGRWPIGVQSYSLRNFKLPEAIRHVQGLGVRNLELTRLHLPSDSSPAQIDEVLAALRKADITLRAHGVNTFTADDKANRQIFEFAKRLGIRNLTANPTADAFESLEKLVAEYDIRICIHNHGPGALYDKLDSVVQAVADQHPSIGVCVDTGHVLRSNENPVDWVRKLGPRVFALHLKDVAEKRKQTHDVILGEGHLRVAELFTALEEVKFPADGSISLEYESNPDNPIDDMKQCLVVAQQAIAKTKS